MSDQVTLAVMLAARAHEGQTDKLGHPYVLHPLAVAAEAVLHDDETAVIVAALHDTVEDTWVTLDLIGQRFGRVVAEAVDALTRREGESYRDFIARCARNDTARLVKRIDLRHNLDRHPYLYEIDREAAKSLYRRYRDAVGYLDDYQAAPARHTGIGEEG